jgi:hypothetical protein
MPNKKAKRSKAVKASIECSTLSTSTNNSPNIKKKIAKVEKSKRGGKPKGKRARAKGSFVEFPNHRGVMQIHKIFKEDETCFAPKKYSEGIRDIYFDNDQTTDEEIIKDSRLMVFQSLSSALNDVLTNPSCIKNSSLQEQNSR